MANNGFLVDHVCVVTPVASPVGQSAVDAWVASHNGLYLNTAASPVQFSVYLPTNLGLYGTSLKVGYQWLNNSTQAYTAQAVYLSPCDSSNFPVKGLDVLAPDISSAILLAVAIWLVWTVGFAIRSLIRSLAHPKDDDEDVI